MTKAENDWFLRGGKRPEREPDTVTTEVVTCQNCGGHNLPGDTECTHCGAPLTGEPSTEEYCGAEDGETGGDEREFKVTVSRFRSVKQETRVTVKADCEESAMEQAEYLAKNHGDGYSWEDVEDSEEVFDIDAEEAEEF